MAWMETNKMDQRVRFIAAWTQQQETVTALAARFGVSRKTAYKWIGRYQNEGPAGLQERSSAPKNQARATPVEIADPIIALRRKHPAWGPRKLRARLALDHPECTWPAASTIGEILKREGLVRPRRPRRRAPPMEHPFAEALAPNDVWCTDFKGWWRTGDGRRCEPFTLSDAMSRYLLACKPVDRTNFVTVWPLVIDAIREFGLPRTIRSDNGPPFGTTAAGGLSRMGVHLIKMGVLPERIRPGKPQQNGRHERMHLTLKKEAATPPSATLAGQKRRLTKFKNMFNHERPHEALGQIPPAKVYTPSPRIWDGKFRSPDYLKADHIRRVRTEGAIRWRGNMLFVSELLKREPVGLFEVGEDEFEVRFGPILLGRIDQKNRMHRIKVKKPPRAPAKCNQRARSETSPM